MKCCMPPWVANLDLQLCVLRSGIAVLAVKGTLDPYMHLHIVVLCFENCPHYLLMLIANANTQLCS